MNLCVALRSGNAERLEKIAIAAAFHDTGIWVDGTFDYLPPSIRLATVRSLAFIPGDRPDRSSTLLHRPGSLGTSPCTDCDGPFRYKAYKRSEYHFGLMDGVRRIGDALSHALRFWPPEP